MTLPANDAFSLGLAHDQSRRTLHSSSTKLPFVTRTSHSPNRTTSQRRFMPTRGPEDSSLVTPPRVETTHVLHSRSLSKSGKKAQVKKVVPQKVPIDWEIPRKTLHSSIGFLTLWLYASHGNPRTVVVVLSTGLAFIVPCDILRLRSARFERIFERCVGFLMRESEKNSSNGVIWYMLGAIFVLSVYPLDVAVVSIMILSWADTAASTIGRLYGPRTSSLPRRLPILNIPLASRKSVAGFMAASVTGACIAIGFWGWIVPMCNTPSSWQWAVGADATNENVRAAGGWVGLSILGVVSGLVSGVAEALDLGSLDDNLTLPIISGGCLWGFFKLVELFAS